jgi:hypothetical protein
LRPKLIHKIDARCQLPSGRTILNDRCDFFSPDGRNLYYVPSAGGDVYDAADTPKTPIPGLTGNNTGAGNNVCGITVDSVAENHFGPWQCAFNLGEALEHFGNFTILTKVKI